MESPEKVFGEMHILHKRLGILESLLHPAIKTAAPVTWVLEALSVPHDADYRLVLKGSMGKGKGTY